MKKSAVHDTLNEPVVHSENHTAILRQAGQVLESEDISKWEMETEPLLDKIYHKLLGESEQRDGTWERNPKLARVMNELGASEYVQELRMRFNINMQMSELTLQDIKMLVGMAGKSFADKIEDNWSLWEISPSESSLKAIARQFSHSLYIFLLIAKDGGMKRHRERRGIKSYLQSPMDTTFGGGL